MTFITAIRSVRKASPALAAVLLGALLALPGQAQTTQRIPVTEIKPLLALAAERGAAHGVLPVPGADYVRRRFRCHSTPIGSTRRPCTPLPQPGCARLEVTTRQRDVLEQGKRADQELRWQVSFCRDGSFPENGRCVRSLDDLRDRANRRGAPGRQPRRNRPVVGARRERRHEGGRRRPRRRRVLAAQPRRLVLVPGPRCWPLSAGTAGTEAAARAGRVQAMQKRLEDLGALPS